MPIEINLLGSTKRKPARAARGRRLRLPSLRGMKVSGDPWSLGVLGLLGVLVVYAAYTYTDARDRKTELVAEVERLVEDSARYADLIAAAERLAARRDTLLRRVQIIQGIDRDRYVWAHVMDEVARAVPDYTWLTAVSAVGEDTTGIRFRIQGNTGNNLALTRFMKDLEASPFIQNVNLVNVEAAQLGAKVINSFVLEAGYQTPDTTAIRLVPVVWTGP
jgi:type IV pilus assembly protein PilN